MAARISLIAFAVCMIATAAAVAAPPSKFPACATAEMSRPLPEPADCLRQAGQTMRGASAAESVQALFERAGEAAEAGRLAEAEQALDCADAVVGVHGEIGLQYERVRQRGIFEYRQDRIPQALSSFECALRLAQEMEDDEAVAKQLKNIGSALRRIGDYAGAMRALTRSLQMQRMRGDAAVGPVLNNIADVYRDLEQRDEAERYYRDALAAFRASGDYLQVTHVYDSLSELALGRRDPQAATGLLESALSDLRALEGRGGVEGARRYQLMILAGLSRAAIAAGDVARARAYAADALALAEQHALTLPAELQLEAARADRLSGQYAPAIARLRAALETGPNAPGMQASLLRELSLTLEHDGRSAEALVALREAYQHETADLRAQRDRGLAWSNARFNLSESQRQLAAAEQESRTRALLLWLTLVSALAVVLLLSVFFLRRQHRAREADAARRARYEEALAHYRREADALAQDRRLLQALLDSRNDALALLDADGQMLAANRAACALLRIDAASPIGQSLPSLLGEADGLRLASAVENMEDAPSQRLILSLVGSGTALEAQLRQWEGGDGLIVISFQPQGGAAESIDPQPELSQRAIEVENVSAPSRDEFRRVLVELMLAVVDLWERNTGCSRIELAERSRIWRVHIDDGRLRARSMERYLAVSKLPDNPRWRDVLRSAYYVLGQCERMPTEAREDLQLRIDTILAYTRREALI
jgi:two-component system, sensor histidine kinase ChiS